MMDVQTFNNSPQQLQVDLDGFIKCWRKYTEYYRDRVIDSIEDLKACDNVLRELDSDFPSVFINAFLYGKISDRMLKRAEEFDKDLFRIKLMASNLNLEEKKKAEDAFEKIETFLAFCAKCKLQMEGRWEA